MDNELWVIFLRVILDVDNWCSLVVHRGVEQLTSGSDKTTKIFS